MLTLFHSDDDDRLELLAHKKILFFISPSLDLQLQMNVFYTIFPVIEK